MAMTRVIKIRLTEEELQILNSDMKSKGITLSATMRLRLFPKDALVPQACTTVQKPATKKPFVCLLKGVKS